MKIKCIKDGPTFYLFVLISLSTLLHKAWGQVGIAYSPFVGPNDNPSIDTYSKDDVKEMLKLIEGQGYPEITTYGVGAQPGRDPSSAHHAAAAAAEINHENGRLSLAVYQGLFAGPTKDLIKNEIDLGIELALSANKRYSGTVKGLIFPAQSNIDALFGKIEGLELVSNTSRDNGLKYGVRLTDCSAIGAFKSNANFRKMVQLLDFVICEMLPVQGNLIDGPKKFLNETLGKIAKAEKDMTVITAGLTSAPIKFILETGWPGGSVGSVQGATVWNMLTLWNLTAKWAKENDKQVFMLEGFDNPWKAQFGEIAKHLGRWKLKQTTESSKRVYELKVGTLPPPPVARSTSGPSKELIFGVFFGLVLFLVLAVMMFVVYKRVQNMTLNKLTPEEIRQFIDGIVTNEKMTEEGPENPWARIPYNRDFELQKNKFTIDMSALLGSGAFGSVYRGKVDGLVNDVAFKMTRADCPVSALRGLLSEIKILIYLGKHENIVSICGAYTTELSNGIVYVATELCSNGSLEKLLRSNKSTYVNLSEIRYVTAPSSLHPIQIHDFQLLRWSSEIASAMEYISSKNIVHADLAARNVLLTLDLTAKVTDFGLSRRLYEYTEYVKKQQEPLPWRWMAIESLKKLEFSVKSDVWSFGIMIWEIFSLGDIPYPGLSWDVNFVTQLENGLRMQRPSRASEALYNIMINCWHLDPAERPSFDVLKSAFLALSNQLHKQHNFDHNILE